MLNARDMYNLSVENGTRLASEIYNESNFKEHSIQRIKEESEKGLFFYNFSFKKAMLETISLILLEKIKPIINEFEEGGFKIVVKSNPSGSWNYINVIFYWGFQDDEYMRLVEKRDRFSEKVKILYYTD